MFHRAKNWNCCGKQLLFFFDKGYLYTQLFFDVESLRKKKSANNYLWGRLFLPTTAIFCFFLPTNSPLFFQWRSMREGGGGGGWGGEGGEMSGGGSNICNTMNNHKLFRFSVLHYKKFNSVNLIMEPKLFGTWSRN